MASLLLLATGASCAVLAACSSPPETTSEIPVAASKESRVTQPKVPAGDAEALADGNAAFATDLYRELVADPTTAGKNVFFSPHSISLALAMTYAGARGNTATQMASALHFSLPQERLHPAFNALDLALAGRGKDAKGADGRAFRLRVTNSLWGAPQTTFATPFLDTLAQSYGAAIRLTDFAADPESSRSTINQWVDKQTEARIKELLPQGSVSGSTQLVLVNATYFNAAWATPFQKGATQPGTFRGLSGDQKADIMSQRGQLGYAAGEGYRAVALPYDGNELSFVAVLPDKLDAFEASLSPSLAQAIAASLAPQEVDLTMPKFKVEGASFSLKKHLVARGMTDAFGPGSDLSGISATNLSISDVIHQAFVAVDEIGTEAAAATAVIADGGASSGPVKVVKVELDRPFVFFVRDNATGAVLFLGRIVNL